MVELATLSFGSSVTLNNLSPALCAVLGKLRTPAKSPAKLVAI